MPDSAEAGVSLNTRVDDHAQRGSVTEIDGCDLKNRRVNNNKSAFSIIVVITGPINV